MIKNLRASAPPRDPIGITPGGAPPLKTPAATAALRVSSCPSWIKKVPPAAVAAVIGVYPCLSVVNLI